MSFQSKLQSLMEERDERLAEIYRKFEEGLKEIIYPSPEILKEKIIAALGNDRSAYYRLDTGKVVLLNNRRLRYYNNGIIRICGYPKSINEDLLESLGLNSWDKIGKYPDMVLNEESSEDETE